MHCLLNHCSMVFPPFAFRKEKPLQAAQEQNFILWNYKFTLQARSFLSPLFGSESQAALLSAAQSVFRLLLFFSQSKRSMQRKTLRRFQWHQCRSCSKKHSFMDFFMHRTLSASYKTLFCWCRSYRVPRCAVFCFVCTVYPLLSPPASFLHTKSPSIFASSFVWCLCFFVFC